jgi:hypothetical protein
MVTGLDIASLPVDGLVALETKLPIPDWGVGAIAFVILLLGMAVVLSIGGGRPHS